MIKEISFDIIKEIWDIKLWPNRKTSINPMSSIILGGGYDMNIYNFTPTFWGAFVNDKLIGVNSGFQTGNGYYRSRGIWIDPEYRRKNIATELMNKIEETAIKEECHTLWSMPRDTAITFYESFGYEKVSDWFDENVEFGPNCYVTKDLK